MFGRQQKLVSDPMKMRHLLTRGVEEVFVRASLEKKLAHGKPLRIKLGFDPTGPRIHIGRAIILRKLREFQDLGHIAVFVVGDFTARIGDPSDKLQKRPKLTVSEIKRNLMTYREQVGKILDLRKAEFHYNSKWLSVLKFEEITELAESFSVQQMSSRRNFKERTERGEEISLREFLYPLMQGYDSVAVSADVEIGGFDQLFNLKAGRIVQRQYGITEQDILTTSMLEGTDGRKMSTSWGNVINIDDEPTDMFGKVMSVQDKLIVKYFTLCTDVSEEEIKNVGSRMEKGELNPRDAKVRLAKEIVAIYHGDGAAQEAGRGFSAVFSNNEFPSDAPVKTISKDMLLADVVADIAGSKSEFARLIGEGAVYDYKTQKKVTDRKTIVSSDMDLRIGKHRFVRLKVSP